MTHAPVLFTHASSLEHDTGAHPESARRIIAIAEAVLAADGCGYERVNSPAASVEVLRANHPGRYVDMIRELAESGGGSIDADTTVSEGSYTAARHAAGGAVALVERLVAREAPCGFSIHRPPGHHAEPARAMGFCLFNNIAVAARFALDGLGLSRVMIVDYDVHHGNGTSAAFHDDPRVLFVSIHQSPLWPGTGPLGDVGTGEGAGFTVNLPVAPGAGDAVFRGLIDGVAVPLMETYAPELVLISAGFDAAAEDPLAQCELTVEGYAGMMASLRAAADAVGAPVGATLEGGYSLDVLGACVVAAMNGLAGEGSAAAPDPVPAGPEAMAEVAGARRYFERWWPVLG